MSVIIRLQNLPWSANALDIRNFFRGLSIPEGGVHIVGGELGDAFIAFSTDEDARQAMMLDGGKIKEIQVKLLLSSRSEMHKVIEAARQSVPLLTLAAPVTVAAPSPVVSAPPTNVPVQPALTSQAAPAITNISPFSAALSNNPLSNQSIPGLGNLQEIPQPAVIEPPPPLFSPSAKEDLDDDKDEDKSERKRSKEKDRRRTRSRSRSRDRDRKERKRDRRDRSRSRDRRRRDRSRSRDRRDRKRDRKDRSRSRDRSPSRRSRDRRNERKSPGSSQEKSLDVAPVDMMAPIPPSFGNPLNPVQGLPMQANSSPNILNGPMVVANTEAAMNRFTDPTIAEAYNKLQELGKKRNPNAFQGDQVQSNGVGRSQASRGGMGRGGGPGGFRQNRQSRFENNDLQRDCCVAIRNAPNHTSYGDVRRFFPFLIDKHGIKMINDNMGRRTGNIFVRFCELRSKHLALQRKSNELKGAQVVVEPLDDESYESAVDSYLPFREENDDEEVSLSIVESEENSRPHFSVLKLTDLPNFVKEHDIIKAFSDFSLLSIMLNDCRISRSKIAYVQFAKPDDARLALERQETYIFGRRKPTITPISDEDFEKEKIKQNDKMFESGLSSPMEKPQDIIVPRDPRQRRQKFDGPAQQQIPAPMQAAAQANFFGAPYVPQTFPAPNFVAPQFGGFPAAAAIDPRTATSTWGNRPPFPTQMETVPGPIPTQHAITTEMDDEPLDCVLMKGLPRDATDRTIVTFLSDTGAVPARIHLMLDTNSLPSGDCFCEFRSTQEARMAATKHGSNLEGCRVSVDLVPRSVVEEALEGPKQPEGLLGAAPNPVFFEQIRGAYSPRPPFRGRGGFDRGGFERGGFNRGGFDQSRGGFEQTRGGFRNRGSFDRGRSNFEHRGRGRGFGRGRGGFTANKENGREEDHDPALEDFGQPGCVVSMENVPFRASIDEILQFFSEFEITHDDVIRRYNERGQPTGDARVAFRTPFDAQRAVKTRHMDTIHDRRINLTIL